MAVALIAWDASAFVKHYLPEPGSEAVETIFTEIAPNRMLVTVMGYVETLACLVRRRNARAMSAAAYIAAKATLRDEILDDPDFGLLNVEGRQIFAGVSLIEQHGLNSADAAILATYLRFQGALPSGRAQRILVSSDKRFLRAATAEGLKTLDPETVAPADVPALVSAAT